MHSLSHTGSQIRNQLGCPVAMGLGYGTMFDLGAVNCFGDEVNMAFKVHAEDGSLSDRAGSRSPRATLLLLERFF